MIVTFRSTAFNTSNPEKYFISSRGYGGDLASWLLHEVSRRDPAAEPMIGQKVIGQKAIGQNGSGWIVRFKFRGATYDFVIAYKSPEWVGKLTQRRGIIDRLFGRKTKEVEFGAVMFLDSVLSSSELFSDVYWQFGEKVTIFKPPSQMSNTAGQIN